jgi:hypothetical protein
MVVGFRNVAEFTLWFTAVAAAEFVRLYISNSGCNL